MNAMRVDLLRLLLELAGFELVVQSSGINAVTCVIADNGRVLSRERMQKLISEYDNRAGGALRERRAEELGTWLAPELNDVSWVCAKILVELGGSLRRAGWRGGGEHEVPQVNDGGGEFSYIAIEKILALLASALYTKRQDRLVDAFYLLLGQLEAMKARPWICPSGLWAGDEATPARREVVTAKDLEELPRDGG